MVSASRCRLFLNLKSIVPRLLRVTRLLRETECYCSRFAVLVLVFPELVSDAPRGLARLGSKGVMVQPEVSDFPNLVVRELVGVAT